MESGWRVYYSDGSVITSTDGVDALEPYGVICILQKKLLDGRYYMTSNAPYYLFMEGEWLPAYENDLVDHLIHNPKSMDKLLVGRIVSKSRFQEIYEKAKADKNAEALD